MASGPISQSSGVLTPGNHSGEARLQKPSFRVSDFWKAPLYGRLLRGNRKGQIFEIDNCRCNLLGRQLVAPAWR